MELTSFLVQQQIDAGHALRLGAESINNLTLIRAKYIDYQVLLLLCVLDLGDRCGRIDPAKVEAVLMGLFGGSMGVL